MRGFLLISCQELRGSTVPDTCVSEIAYSEQFFQSIFEANYCQNRIAKCYSKVILIFVQTLTFPLVTYRNSYVDLEYQVSLLLSKVRENRIFVFQQDLLRVNLYFILRKSEKSGKIRKPVKVLGKKNIILYVRSEPLVLRRNMVKTGLN